MSAATIDRYLAPIKATNPIRGKSTTRPGNLLRNSITIGKAGDEVSTEPGFFEVDTLTHCGPTLKGGPDRESLLGQFLGTPGHDL